MSFLSRLRKPRKTVAEVMSYSTLFRWYCYDTGVEDPNELSIKLGLTPLSSEVEDMELDASSKRLEEIEPLVHFLNAIADINSRVIAENQISLLADSLTDISPEDKAHMKEHMAKLTHMVSFAALVSGFSSALSVGLIERMGSAHDKSPL